MSFLVLPHISYGDETDELENDLQTTRNQIQQYESQLNNTKAQIEAAKRQAASYAGALQSYSGQLAYAQAQLEQTRLELEQKQLELENTEAKVREATLSVQYHERVLKRVARDFYKKSFGGNISFWFSESTFGDAARTATYRSRVSDNFHEELSKIVGMLDQLVKQKEQLAVDKENFEKQQQELTAQQVYLQRQIAATRSNLASVQSQQTSLLSALTGIEVQLGSLTLKQQEILQKKAAAALATTSVGEYEINLSAIVGPAPSGGGPYFSFWTYGYIHQVGMSQYGAYGRAKAGQNAATILNAYYQSIQLGDYSGMQKIKVANVTRVPRTCNIQSVNTIQEMDFEDDYLKGIAEMPTSWHIEALKAQAIAARSYAIALVQSGKNSAHGFDIADDTCDQAYNWNKKDKPENAPWRQAVDLTKHQVIRYNGSIIPAYYHSTAGGFTRSSEDVWGGNRAWAQGIADLDPLSRPYDGPDHGNSPWYHKAWGNQPWLNGDEVADLFNAALLPTQYNNSLAASEFSVQQVRNTLSNHGVTPVDKVQAVEITGTNSRSSNVLRVYYNNGQSREVDAQRFKYVFNLRSPGTDAIWTPRFDVVSAN